MDAQLFPDEKDEKSYADSQDVDDDTSAAVVGVSTGNSPDSPEGPDAQLSLALSS